MAVPRIVKSCLDFLFFFQMHPEPWDNGRVPQTAVAGLARRPRSVPLRIDDGALPLGDVDHGLFGGRRPIHGEAQYRLAISFRWPGAKMQGLSFKKMLEPLLP
jgi:hypothetical protein